MFPLRDSTPRYATPWMTLALVAANVGAFGVELSVEPGQRESFISSFALIPARDGYHPLPMLTSMFLHGGLLHLFSNLWTLWIFGDNVEDRMGRRRYLLFYLLCGVAAAVTHVYTAPESRLPVIGASGAIAGVLGAYFVMYPRARLVCLVPVFFYPLFIEVPAFLFGLLWFGLQILSATLSDPMAGGSGGVAWWAHVGGFAAGVVLHRLFLIGRPPRVYAGRYGLAGRRGRG